MITPASNSNYPSMTSLNVIHKNNSNSSSSNTVNTVSKKSLHASNSQTGNKRTLEVIDLTHSQEESKQPTIKSILKTSRNTKFPSAKRHKHVNFDTMNYQEWEFESSNNNNNAVKMEVEEPIAQVDTKPYYGDEYDSNGKLRYKGEWLNKLYHGNGRLYYTNSTRFRPVLYAGPFDKGQRCGKNGKSYHFNGNPDYVGQWKNDLPHGNGQAFDPETKQMTYDGRWQNGKKNGYGFLFDLVTGKKIYEGYLKDEKRCGLGTSFNPTTGDREYHGYWKDDLYEGKGVKYHPGGILVNYDGEWQKGLRYGQGDQEDKQSRLIYSGWWVNDLYEGDDGQWYSTDGLSSYKGQWKEGKMDGFGTYKYSNGNTYEGNFEKGLKQGDGEWINSRGKCFFKGKFEKEIAQSSQYTFDAFGKMQKKLTVKVPPVSVETSQPSWSLHYSQTPTPIENKAKEKDSSSWSLAFTPDND